ncbi:MAG: hypothetical protein E7379_04500 [Clostridiales bacterium]|nr:hypothetical protein [Clostridiales bacterium]
MALMFNGRPNRYYLDKEDCKKLTIQQLRAYKYNNQFLISVFSLLNDSDGRNPEDALGFKLPCILENKLPKPDSETGIPSNNLGAKINFLIQTLKNSEADRQKFVNSFFYQAIEILRRGSLDYTDGWDTYKISSKCPDLHKDKNPFTLAILSHSKTNELPIGLDFTKLIDSLIGTDKNGKYYIRTDFDKMSSNAREINLACEAYLKMIKTNPMFNTYCEKIDESASELY